MSGKIGIDIGGVIIDKGNDREDTSLFGPKYLEARAVVGAISAIQKLNQEVFLGEVYLVSKCGEKVEERSREWLKANAFHEKTGVPQSRLRFCRERADKAPIARELGLTHFIDDKVEVLGYMRGIVANRILFNPRPNDLKYGSRTAGPMVLAFSWDDVLEHLGSVDGEKGGLDPSAERLKSLFIRRLEFDEAKAVRDLVKIAATGEAEDEAFVVGEKAKDQLIEDQQFDMASVLRDLLFKAKRAVESKSKA